MGKNEYVCLRCDEKVKEISTIIVNLANELTIIH